MVKRGLWAGSLVLAGVGCVQGQVTAAQAAGGQAPQQAAKASQTVRGDANPVLERVLAQWPAGAVNGQKSEWSSDEGVLLDGMLAEWRVTGDGRLFEYVKAAVDRAVDQDGNIHVGGGPFPVAAHSLDDIEMGRSVLTLYRVLQQERYYKAAKFLHDQMELQPKNSSGGYWQMQSGPNQMWLDGAYMAEPFLEGYGNVFDRPKETDEVATQLLLMDAKLREKQTGLLRQGWDPGAQAEWANKKSGLSEEISAQAMGWYAMALVDVLERMSANDPQRAAVEAVTRRVLTAVGREQDPESGLWWQVMDKGGQKGNFLEASASCMFVYALAKGVREGVAPGTLESNVTRGWEGIEVRFVKADGTFSGSAKSAGPGASFEAYAGRPVADDDAKGVGAYLLALSEITQRRRAGDLMRKALGKTVLLDAWFNSQKRKTAEGNLEFFHYKWGDNSNSGYSTWARMFQQYGMHTEVLDHAPRAEDLKGVDIYVIVSPDIPALNPNPHYMDKASADAIDAWVKAGGVLVMMENDVNNADQTYLDLLSDKFGVHYNPVRVNEELGDDYSTTIVNIPAGTGGIFKHAHRAVMKETCTITVSAPAKTVLTNKGEAFMAVAYPGKGVVFANVDPWIYNEYTDGRKTPLGEDNFAAGQELTHWLVNEAMTH